MALMRAKLGLSVLEEDADVDLPTAGGASAGAADAAGGGSTAAGDYGLAQALLDAMDSAGADCEPDRGGGPVTRMHTHANMHRARLRLVF